MRCNFCSVSAKAVVEMIESIEAGIEAAESCVLFQFYIFPSDNIDTRFKK